MKGAIRFLKIWTEFVLDRFQYEPKIIIYLFSWLSMEFYKI